MQNPQRHQYAPNHKMALLWEDLGDLRDSQCHTNNWIESRVWKCVWLYKWAE